jgi:hypothetical protein
VNTKPDDGGPAFPFKIEIPGGSFNPFRNRTVPVGEVDVECSQGMSLRDYFAAKAGEADIEAHRTGPVTESVVDDGYGRKTVRRGPLERTREQAKFAYADAMMKAREA